MPKNMLQDVLPKERRTIRQVPLPSSRRNEEPEDSGEILYEQPEERTTTEPEGERGEPRYILWGAAAFFVALFIALASWSLNGATITVVPKSTVASLNDSFTATAVGGSGSLHVQPVPLIKTAEKTIPADVERRVSEKASGRIVVYNNFSATAQRLIKNTRFQTPDGLVFRIDHSLIVPGKTRTEKGFVPGRVEAVVYADAAGDEYNIPLADFTVPGFKNDPARFRGFYARSKTPMTGGREGLVRLPSEETERAARTALSSELRGGILSAARTQTPEGYILFPNAVAFVAESLPLESVGKDSALVKERISATVYLFKSSELAAAIATKSVPSYDGLPVEVPNLSDLTFALAETVPTTGANGGLRFTLKGSPRVVSLVDAAKLQGAIAGKPKADLTSFLSSFPAVLKADVTVRPFWSRTFPENPRKINVKVVPPAAP